MILALLAWPEAGQAQPWSGGSVTLNVNETDHMNQPRDPEVMQRVLEFIDAMNQYYADVTGISKGSVTVSMADLPSGFEAGAYLEGNEIWIERRRFNVLYAGAMSNDERYDQTIAYELGRLYYHFEGVLGQEFATAFAILMRFAAMEDAGYKGNMLGGRQFADFKAVWANFESVFSREGSARIVRNDAALAQLEGNTLNLGSGDLLASIVWKLATEYEEAGGEGGKKVFLTRFFRKATELDGLRQQKPWYMNIVACCEHGAQTQGLLRRFQRDWHWPRE